MSQRTRKVAAALTVLAFVLMTVSAMPVRTATAATTSYAKPTQTQVNAALTLASGYLGGLINPAGSYRIVSEYYGLPISIVIPGTPSYTWPLGLENPVPGNSGCGTEMVSNSQGYSSETEVVSFDWYPAEIACAGTAPEIQATVNWAYSPSAAYVCLKNLFYSTALVPASVVLYFGPVQVATLSHSNVGATFCLVVSTTIPMGTLATYPKGDFASFRYTVRHGEQMAYDYAYESGQTTTVTNAIQSFITNQNYSLGFDIYAPLANNGVLQGKSLPDSYIYYTGGSSTTDVYWDCSDPTTPYSSLTHYRYDSKVCLLGGGVYVDVIAEGDSLSAMLWALHVLEKYNAPDTTYCAVDQNNDGRDLLGALQNCWTPRNVMRYVEAHYLAHDGSGNLIGLGPCSDFLDGLSFSCDLNVANQPRTAVALALESELGYVYGDATSVHYADSFAQILLQTQMTGNTFKVAGGSTYYRPLQKGGFYTVWDDLNFYSGVSLTQKFSDMLGMDSEYAGWIPANQEATQTAWLALNLYNSVAYTVFGGGSGGSCGLRCHPDPPLDFIMNVVIQLIPLVVLIGVVGFVVVYLKKFSLK